MVLAPLVAGLFKWRQFEPKVILLAVGWYLRFSLSYRDVEEPWRRGLAPITSRCGRWLCPGNGMTFRRRLKTTNDSWRMDETYVRVKGNWVHLYRVVDPAMRRSISCSRPNAIQRRLGAIDSYLYQLLDIVY
jgi:transposase-like protein